MPKTQVTERELKDRILTGASFHPDLMIYDETQDYTSGTIVWWKGDKYEALNNITGGTEGDLSNAPDVNSTDWEKKTAPVYNIYPSSSQSFTNSRITILFDNERISNSAFTLNTSTGEITCNSSGIFLIHVMIATDNTSTSRDTSTGYLQIDNGSGWTDVSDFTLHPYNRGYSDGKNSASGMIPLQLNSGDQLRVQVVGRSTTSLSTVPTGCGVTIFGVNGSSGPKGDKGDVGPSGDFNWRGTYDPTETYNENDVVFYQGSSWHCDQNGVVGQAPYDGSSYWSLVAEKGSDGAGSTITIQSDNSDIPNTPHGILNFHDMEIQDEGSGVAGVSLKYNTIATATNASAQTFNNASAVSIQTANSKNSIDVTISGTNFTIQNSGKYRVKGKVNITNTTNTRSTVTLQVTINGTAYSPSKVYIYSRNSADGNNTGYIDFVREFRSGDVINFTIISNHSANLQVVTNESYFEIERIYYTS